MRDVIRIVLLAFSALALAACSLSQPEVATSVPSRPTPEIEGTVRAAVQATVAAIVTPTAVTETITADELSAAANRAQFLTTRYGLPANEVASLTKSTYDVASRLRLASVKDRIGFQELVLDFAEHGGSGLRDFGVEGDNESVARRLGYANANALLALTPNQVVHARALMATVGLTKYLIGN
jgi:hypothetical protein